jgi:GT2 family glycosyltransferase
MASSGTPSAKTQNAIGIVIVTYNSGDEIGPCLDAALATGAEIVVVDNASTDHTIAEVAHRGARLIANAGNRGFAAAVNQGFRALACPYVLLLNPDAVIESPLDSMREACDLPKSAGAGGLLLGSDGAPQTGFMVRRFPTAAALILEALLLNRIWPGNPVNRRYRALDLALTGRSSGCAPTPVEQPAGAFLMVRRAVWEELGGFDEAFHPLWFEDVDFCKRLASRGYLLYFAPTAVAKHTGGHSIPRLSVEMRRVYWYGSLLRFTAKHFRPMAFRAVCLAVVTGSILRGFAETAQSCSLQPMAACGKVVRLAGRYLFTGWREGPAVASRPNR